MSEIILFLDFDGVISSYRAKEARGEWIDPIACELIARLQERHGFRIVVSSTWRLLEDRAPRALEPSGLRAAPHEDWRTIESGHDARGQEIDDWLRRHGEPEFVILDDETFDFTERQRERLILCDSMNGLLFAHYRALDSLLLRLNW